MVDQKEKQEFAVKQASIFNITIKDFKEVTDTLTKKLSKEIEQEKEKKESSDKSNKEKPILNDNNPE